MKEGKVYTWVHNGKTYRGKFKFFVGEFAVFQVRNNEEWWLSDFTTIQDLHLMKEN